jgi:hypothetical protein
MRRHLLMSKHENDTQLPQKIVIVVVSLSLQHLLFLLPAAQARTNQQSMLVLEHQQLMHGRLSFDTDAAASSLDG